MKKELEYFNITNSYGGNQDWFHDPMMKLGGCAAITAVDLLLAFPYQGYNLYRLRKISELNKEKYLELGMEMKPFLKPRFGGIKKLDIFTEGINRYLETYYDKKLILKEYKGNNSYEDAKSKLKEQLDQGIPIPYLMLKNKNHAMNFFTWHWFLIVGYEETNTGVYAKVATYGKAHWLDFREMWITGYQEVGGFIEVSLP